MCQPIVCAKMKWKPQIFPDYRPPRQGWRILEMPDIAPIQIRQAWGSKQPQSNRNGVAAVQEMVDFLSFNKVKVTKEMVEAIQQQGDAEWCHAEPSRCPRTAGTALVRKVAAEDKKTVSRAVAKSQGFFKKVKKALTPKKSRRCCGG